MNRNSMTNIAKQGKINDHKQRIAFHEAGHAAAICLNNKARNFPPIFFQIILKDISGETDFNVTVHKAVQGDCIAKVEGGRLVESFTPQCKIGLTTQKNSKSSLAENCRIAIETEMTNFMLAFETDIINLLIGPLSEAKYIALRDDELFNQQLINLKALNNYGGVSDLNLINTYLQSVSDCKQYQAEKLDKLFESAFNFINDHSNWEAITQLAYYIIISNKNRISCEEISLVLEQEKQQYREDRYA